MPRPVPRAEPWTEKITDARSVEEALKRSLAFKGPSFLMLDREA
jgi:hypothetical protein